MKDEAHQDRITKALMIFAKAFLEGDIDLAISAARAWHDLIKYAQNP